MIRIITILFFVFSLNALLQAQKLSFDGHKFVLNSSEFSIHKAKDILVLDSINRVLYHKVVVANNYREIFKMFTIIYGTSAVASFAGLVYFNQQKNPYVNSIGGITSAYILIASIPATILSATGLLITSYKRKKRINAFLDSYNNKMISGTKSKLKVDLKLNITNIGLVFTF